MPFKEKSFPVYFLGLFGVGVFSLWTFTQNGGAGYNVGTSQQQDFSSRAPSSYSEEFETVSSCGSERNYLLSGINALPAEFRQTRYQVSRDQIPRSCVTYIMNHFIDAKTAKSMSYGHCPTKEGQPVRGTDGTGMYMPCVTESYSNSVYNSLLDVSDCLNIPVKELLPKLANESGLHVNTLGPDADGGVGQLTRAALASVFMRFDNIPDRESTLDYYINEMGKSSKKSCQRILNQKSAYKFKVPAGMRLCQTHETDDNCFKPWMVQSRCEFMTAPDNPLRNVLFTAIYYKTMQNSAVGVVYRGGQDMIWQEGGLTPIDSSMKVNGFIGRQKLVERLDNLGIRRPSQEVFRQIIVSFGFNGGIGTGQVLVDNYLKLRESKGLSLTKADLDFQNVSIAPWSLITNPISFINMMGANDEDFAKAWAKIENVKNVKLDPEDYRRSIEKLRAKVRKAMEPYESAADEAGAKKAKVAFVEQSEEIRREVLNDVFDRAEYLTLPEFMRIGHAWTIAFKKGGGAPGYLSFLAGKHKELVKELGEGVCTADQYLQF